MILSEKVLTGVLVKFERSPLRSPLSRSASLRSTAAAPFAPPVVRSPSSLRYRSAHQRLAHSLRGVVCAHLRWSPRGVPFHSQNPRTARGLPSPEKVSGLKAVHGYSLGHSSLRSQNPRTARVLPVLGINSSPRARRRVQPVSLFLSVLPAKEHAGNGLPKSRTKSPARTTLA